MLFLATADHQTSSVTLPLYNSSKQGHLYDRDVSLYDSKSTLASVSSLDVSSIIETNKSQSMDLSLSSQSRGNEHNAKLSEELSQKQDRINELEKSYRGLMSTSKMEIESLKKSNVKYEQSVQVCHHCIVIVRCVNAVQERILFIFFNALSLCIAFQAFQLSGYFLNEVLYFTMLIFFTN